MILRSRQVVSSLVIMLLLLSFTNVGQCEAEILRDEDNFDVLVESGIGLADLTAVAYLPLIVKNVDAPVPTSTPPPSGANVQCRTPGAAEICAWVSNGSPAQNPNVTVYGRLIVNNAGQFGQVMNVTWKYKTTNSFCSENTVAMV